MQTHERIRAIRIDHDMTQQEMAEIIECSSKQVMRYEKGEQEMSITKLKKLCRHFHISADYILGLPKNMNWPR